MAEMFNMVLIFGMSRSKMMLKHQVLGDYFMTRFSKPKKSIILMLALIMTLSLLMLTLFGCTKLDPNDYTVDEHIQMIREKVEDKFISEDGLYTSISGIYPIYNLDDELTHFLVEFEPYGFMFIKLRSDSITPISRLLKRQSTMYVMETEFGDGTYAQRYRQWRRYRYSDENGKVPEPFNEYGYNHTPDEVNRYYELDENGDFIYYQHSPYAVAGKPEGKLYFVNSKLFVKNDDKYLNLVSMLWYNKDSIAKSREPVEDVSFTAGSQFLL